MKTSFDLDFRPTAYWGPQSLSTWYGSRISGEQRRLVAVEEADDYDGDPAFLASTLQDGLRSAVGAIHPIFMSGEYLPPLRPNEVEIARVVLKSTTGDVTSIRARRTKHRIIYRIVDEYMEQGSDRFKTHPKSSNKPLTLRQLIQLIDANDLVIGPRELNYNEGGMGYDEIYDFATVSSEFYPQIASWFDEANEAWRLDREQECQEDEDEEIKQALDQARWDTEIEAFVSKWKMQKSNEVGTWSGSLGRSLRIAVLWKYTREYCRREAAFPTGSHTIYWSGWGNLSKLGSGVNSFSVDFS